ncbi:hypothetical protein AMIS_46160 [Actinoplanes missouriensis 431]|uniref:DUF1707 domain-containing protein n=1 Tax=Actinoplanes missouriensis (strain ATCC 14538 / DSM 43046 / CBS 188.64 / JCM 3121 / NBRC 102363 / NCIMB 12654 / NRRL B-3342 / UNCC 431) TaxID=512565 RepID=I0H9Z9_ACTM4|nr:hypothetical protein AMIS_46160 [Actinoplanes missouriensis 431]
MAELLHRACGDGRLTLEEFSVRVDAVRAAEDASEEGVAPTPVVGSSRTADRVITGCRGRSGRGQRVQRA